MYLIDLQALEESKEFPGKEEIKLFGNTKIFPLP